jgi:hypothetical protein
MGFAALRWISSGVQEVDDDRDGKAAYLRRNVR